MKSPILLVHSGMWLRMFVLGIATAFCGICHATHLRAVELNVQQQCGTLTFKIYVTVYTNTGSGTQIHGDIFFGDGQVFTIGNEAAQPRPDLGQNIGVYQLTLTHTYAVAGIYKIVYRERDRSPDILNIPDSEDVAYCTYTSINASATRCNRSPILSVAPVDRVCKGVAFLHSPGASDSDGDSLSYEMTIPLAEVNANVAGYRSPIDRSFYSNYDVANELGNGPPILFIDPETGLLTWDAPERIGAYNVAFKVIEWRRDIATGSYFIISETIRDMQIIVEDCLNTRPQLSTPVDLCVEAGTVVEGLFVATDFEGHPVKIEVFSAVLETAPNFTSASLTPANTDFRTAPDTVRFRWETNCFHVRDQSYQVVVKVTDDSPGNSPQLVTFKTWNIRVIAPAPEWSTIQPDLVNRTAKLEWNPYTCGVASRIQVWRRVGTYPFSVTSCEAGISPYRGYELIGDFDPSTSEFTDTNHGRKLAMGATYCYRLVALFTNPGGGKSYVSEERCIGPILIDAPLITNVSVLETNVDEGKIQVQWYSPPDISKVQFPEPYQYEVFRATGFNGEENIINVSGRITDTVFTDTAPNTLGEVYNYRIVLYSRTQHTLDYNAIDTSDVASSVFLKVIPGEKKVTLTWDADVPWSNVVPSKSFHKLYRKSDNGEFELLELVDVTTKGFTYTDSLLQEEDYFCYKVVTLGSYGNPAFDDVENASQILCASPVSDRLPCKPIVAIEQNNCDERTPDDECVEREIKNDLSWVPQFGPGCRRDIVQYNVYRIGMTNEATLVASVPFSSWQDVEISSFAFCYRVAAVDASGGEGELSDVVCNDNCPYFELPNVFTPNGDGCNDHFAAYRADTDSGSPCKFIERHRCARFVSGVKIQILNRWGREVYSFRSSDENSIYINWDGRDKKGELLDPGIYYYVANVTFDTLDPQKRSKQYKGWVNLLH